MIYYYKIPIILRKIIEFQKIRSGKHLGRISKINSDVTINGSIFSKGVIYFSGKIDGDIQCNKLFLDEGALVKGSVSAEIIHRIISDDFAN